VQTLFIVSFCRCCPRKRKKEKKVLLPTGVSKSTAHTVVQVTLLLSIQILPGITIFELFPGGCCALILLQSKHFPNITTDIAY
jgi:hypothetical protein